MGGNVEASVAVMCDVRQRVDRVAYVVGVVVQDVLELTAQLFELQLA